MDEVVFIVSTAKQQSRRDHFLQSAKVRSHAARVSSTSRPKKIVQKKILAQEDSYTKRILLPKDCESLSRSWRTRPVTRVVIKHKQRPIIPKCRNLVSHSRSQDEAAVAASHESYNERKNSTTHGIILDASTRSIPRRKSESTSTTAVSIDVNQAKDGKQADDKYRLNSSTFDNDLKKIAEMDYMHAKLSYPLNFAQRGAERIRRALHGDTASHRTSGIHRMPALFSSPLQSSSFDPFSSSPALLDYEVKSSLNFYFKIIRPFVCNLIPGWDWFPSLSEAQSKPVLAYAIAALSSAFHSGCVKGGPGVVLPPLLSDMGVSRSHGDGLLWPVPPWLRLQATCVHELNKELAQQNGAPLDEGVFQAVLFLFRLAVLLADGPSARMHLTALEQMEKLGSGRQRVDKGKELAVQRINLVAAFCSPPSLVVVKTKPDDTHVIEIDRKDWDDKKYWSHLAPLNGRVIAWRVNALRAGNDEVGRREGDWIQRDCEAALEVMDPGCRGTLHEADWTDVVDCYQIALYVAHYLNSVSYNTGKDGVREQVLELKRRLDPLDLGKIYATLPTTIFYILLAGAMGSRGRLERPWFVRALAELYERDLPSMNDVLVMVERCVDPRGMCWRVIEEIWEEVVERRLERLGVGKSELGAPRMDLYKTNVTTLLQQKHPSRYKMDPKTERRVVVRETDFA